MLISQRISMAKNILIVVLVFTLCTNPGNSIEAPENLTENDLMKAVDSSASCNTMTMPNEVST